MRILAFAEQRDGKLKKVAFEVAHAAVQLAGQIGAEAVGLVIGNGVEKDASELGGFGIGKVYAAEGERLSLYSTTAYAKVVSDAAESLSADIVLFPASAMGKDLAPRVAGRLKAGLAADCIALKGEGGSIVATRPVYAGKGLIDLKINSPRKVFTLRPNVFSPGGANGTAATVERLNLSLQDSDFLSKVIGVTFTKAGRPDLTEANIIVSGGRGLGGPDNFKMIEDLADVLGAAVGASRAAVDAGWRPHEDQVGQTGKTVSPSLYVAVAISGAIQHLAGMSSSKFIVAINKDKDAPIFQVADYGIVGDAFEVIPELSAQMKKALGKD
ncbi:MAG: electron transfer flavoprotein subunit alpha/FixB family protein [Bacteroidetes bacterium]|nr:electron transfer flavoprotein subunit alpha/FixB family protein [Bacteroidota bacterium]MCL5268061.1 electron transfer flavoprotein subunit alpha/FixB family protein [Bacteroidota bacterium]